MFCKSFVATVLYNDIHDRAASDPLCMQANIIRHVHALNSAQLQSIPRARGLDRRGFRISGLFCERWTSLCDPKYVLLR